MPADRFDCPLCPWFVDATITVCDPAPGCTLEETFVRHRAVLAEALRVAATNRLIEHLRSEHADWADLQLPA